MPYATKTSSFIIDYPCANKALSTKICNLFQISQIRSRAEPHQTKPLIFVLIVLAAHY